MAQIPRLGCAKSAQAGFAGKADFGSDRRGGSQSISGFDAVLKLGGGSDLGSTENRSCHGCDGLGLAA